MDTQVFTTTIPFAYQRILSECEPGSYDLWIDPGMQNIAAISELLKPYDARLMRSFPVSTRINHVANDDEECSRPVEIVGIRIGYSRNGAGMGLACAPR